MATFNLRGFSLRVALTAASFMAFVSVEAEANRMNDWQCLTSDMTGDPGMRDAYIRASKEAAEVFNIAPSILVGIKRVESGRGLNPHVTNRNTNGTTDRGFYQVNAEVWLPELQRVGTSIRTDDLHGVRENALIAAWILRRQMNRSDVPSALEAVGFYHKGGGQDATSKRIRQVYKDRFMKALRGMMARCG